jgi:hypothetical protein
VLADQVNVVVPVLAVPAPDGASFLVLQPTTTNAAADATSAARVKKRSGLICMV